MPVAWRVPVISSEMTPQPAKPGHVFAGLQNHAGYIVEGVRVMSDDKQLPNPADQAPTKETAPKPETPHRFDDWAAI